MAAHGDNKIEEFQEASEAIIGAAAQAVERPSEMLQNVFAIAHDSGTNRVQTNLLQQVLEGNVDFKDVSIRINAAGALLFHNEIQKNKGRESADMQRLMSMLDELDRLARDLSELNEAVRQGSQSLKDKYGGIDGIAETFLTPDEREGLETEEEIYAAMADKYLNPNGTPKEGAEHLDPEVIAFLQVFQRREHVALEANQIVRDARELGIPLQPEEEAKLEAASVLADGFERSAMINAVADVEGAQEVIVEPDLKAEAALTSESSGGFTLGR